MENNERNRKLDQWLDEALSQYSAAEPRLGLEQRVLTHVRAGEKTRTPRRTWWRWMPAFAAIAAVMIVTVAVRPYWEEKHSTVSTYIPAPTAVSKAAPPKSQEADQVASPQQSPAPARKLTTNAITTTREKQAESSNEKLADVRKLDHVGTAADVANNDSSLAAPAAVATGKAALSKDEDKAARPREARSEPVVTQGYRQLPTTASAPVAPAPKPATFGGIVAGNVTTGSVQGRRSDAPSAMQAETIEVNPAEQTVQAQAGMVGTDRNSKMPPVAAKQMKTMKAKAAGPLAKKLEENVDTVNVPGMPTLRTNLKNVPLGSTQQFPSPAPLSEQEKLMLTAAKQMKKPAKEEKQDSTDDQLKEIDIKKIEIAPLPGPPK